MTRAAVASFVALVLGFLAGRWSSPALPQAPVAAPVVADPPVRAAAPPATLPDCQQQLALALGVLEAAEIERMGTPVPFPEDLAEELRPENFERNVRDAVAACPDADVRLARIDCEEYPCMAFFSQPNGGSNRAADDLRNCAAWQERFGTGGGQASYAYMADDGVHSYLVATPSALGEASDDNGGRRFVLRHEEGRAELLPEWDGRELTELEALDHLISLWRENATEEMMPYIEGLEKQRTQLAAKQD